MTTTTHGTTIRIPSYHLFYRFTVTNPRRTHEWARTTLDNILKDAIALHAATHAKPIKNMPTWNVDKAHLIHRIVSAYHFNGTPTDDLWFAINKKCSDLARRLAGTHDE
jgi:hypothetical protein